VEDGVHLLGDGHLDLVASGETEGGGGAADAFGDLAVESGEDVGELAALPSSMPTARLRERVPVQVSTRSPTPERPARVCRWPPQAIARRVISAMPRVMRAAAELLPRLRPWTTPAAQRDDVLQCAAQFDSGDVLVSVEAQGW